jgi:hypothetical protein
MALSRSTLLYLVVPLGLLGLLGARPASAVPTPAVSRVDRVVVFSDRARVFRVATLELPATETEAAVADLPASALQESVRVESKTARVVRVDLLRSRERLPRQVRAEELVKKIEALVDQIVAVADERAILRAELDLLASLRPRLPSTTPPEGGRASPPEGIFADAWERVIAWVEARSLKARARLLVLSSSDKRLRQQLHPLCVEAAELDPASAREPISRVVATLHAKPGRHAIEVSYLVPEAKWVPSYDLGYDHASKTVEATYYAVVSQSTGEDWEGAKLEFSTEMPHGLVAIPEIPTILLGRKRDFTPAPRARLEPPPRVWVAPPPAEKQDAAMERLRRVLAEAVRVTGQPLSLPQGSPAAATDKSTTTTELREEEKQEAAGKKEAPKGGEWSKNKLDDAKVGRVEFDSRNVRGQMQHTAPAQPVTETTIAPAKTPAPAPPPAEPSPEKPRPSLQAPGSAAAGPAPMQELPWLDGVYRPPAVDPDSPYAGAKGYLFTLAAPGRHRVAATGTSRRIPILRSRLSVDPVHRIVPGLSLSAYLLAELTNRTGLPILRGNAHVFAASMFTGRSWLNTALPGQKLELPLGVDDSVKVARHLDKKTQTRGILSREDTTDFTVEIEVANNRSQPIRVEVEDQVPVKQDEKGKVDIRAFSSSSFSVPDKKGRVIFRGTVPASSVKKVSFAFQVVRPKDWEVTQHDD